MPNWVDNALNFEGSKEDISKIKEQLSRPRKTYWAGVEEEVSGEPISYWNMISPPEEKFDLYFGGGNLASEDKTWGWYNWNVSNWGCKWDASEAMITAESENQIVYHFQSPWSPPIEAISKLSEQYPETKMSLYWIEEQGFGAEQDFNAGEMTTLNSWDIPNTHQENMDIKDYCWRCEDSDDDLYDDCPNAKEVEPEFSCGCGNPDCAKVDN